MNDDRQAPTPQSGCASALLIGFGAVLLVPGACSLFFLKLGVASGATGLGLVVSIGGLGFIVFGAQREFARQKSAEPAGNPDEAAHPGAARNAGSMVLFVVLAVCIVIGMLAWAVWRSLGTIPLRN